MAVTVSSSSVGKLCGSADSRCSEMVGRIASRRSTTVHAARTIAEPRITMIPLLSSAVRIGRGSSRPWERRVRPARGGGAAMPWNGPAGGPGIDLNGRGRLRSEVMLRCGEGIPEENIELQRNGVPSAASAVGEGARCAGCEASGAVECLTCAGSGLYLDSILESQGILVKVKCLGCGGSGSVMCPSCGGRGHTLI